MTTHEGSVVRIVRDRGFGFIRNTATGVEYFFHRSQADDFDHMSDGDLVEFATAESPKGPRAVDVVKLPGGRR